MDGVVADFDEYAQRTIGAPPSTGIYPDKIWQKLAADQRLYKNLKLKPGAGELVEWLQYHVFKNPSTRLTFLTAIPKNNDVPFAFYDKVRWADNHFPGIPVLFGPYSQDKWRHCQTGDILIDDRVSNCTEWEAAGGLAHQYTDWTTCERWLEKTLTKL